MKQTPLSYIVLAAAFWWHFILVFAPSATPPPPGSQGRDYASYHYAAVVASNGQNPYNKAALAAAASSEGTRTKVHPYFYPPPFLLTTLWASSVSLLQGFQIWFWLNELALLVTVIALSYFWRAFSTSTTPAVAALLALFYAAQYGAEMGQANHLVLALVVLSLGLANLFPVASGALLGAAAMAKMSPGLLVLFFFVQKRYIIAGSAMVTALFLTLISLIVVGSDTQLHFYQQVLPGLIAGDYNGLTIKIGLFANHSVANIWHQLITSTNPTALSSGAKLASMITNLLLVVGVVGVSVRPSRSSLSTAGLHSSWLALLLLIPVYTYEHHLVFALPAMVILTIAAYQQRIGPLQAFLGAFSVVVLLVDLPTARKLNRALEEALPLQFFAQEAKTLAIILLIALCATLDWSLEDNNVRTDKKSATS